MGKYSHEFFRVGYVAEVKSIDNSYLVNPLTTKYLHKFCPRNQFSWMTLNGLKYIRYNTIFVDGKHYS